MDMVWVQQNMQWAFGRSLLISAFACRALEKSWGYPAIWWLVTFTSGSKMDWVVPPQAPLPVQLTKDEHVLAEQALKTSENPEFTMVPLNLLQPKIFHIHLTGPVSVAASCSGPVLCAVNSLPFCWMNLRLQTTLGSSSEGGWTLKKSEITRQ